MKPTVTTTEEPKQVCDLCGSARHQIFATRGRGGSKLTTVICDDEDQMAAAEQLQLLTGAALVVAPRRGFLRRLTITTTGNKP